jgi:hypothetical protein
MTLKQWLDSYSVLTPELIAAHTAAYYQDQEYKAARAFDAAFLKLQAVLPVIDEQGQIEYRDGRKGSYALNEDIQAAILPILQQHGFTIHFETVHPDPYRIAVTGVLTHKRGHQRRSTFESMADTSGGKSVAQGRGSILSYGHRYTTVDLLNLITRGLDDDAQILTFGFHPAQLPDPKAKATFKTLMEAALEDTLDECWGALDMSERASVGYECLGYVKQLAGYVR